MTHADHNDEASGLNWSVQSLRKGSTAQGAIAWRGALAL